MKKTMEPMETINFACPARIKRAGVEEARRRGLSLAGMIKDYMSKFLPENVEKSIIGEVRGDNETTRKQA